MKLFFAGLDFNEFRRYLPYSARYAPNQMHTYFDFRKKRSGGEKFWAQYMDQLGVLGLVDQQHQFLDSGAYSAFTLNEVITVDEYAEFLTKYQDQLYMYASLDNKADQRETYENYIELRRRGFNPAPVWHAVGGDLAILKEYLTDPDVPLVCVGAIAKERGRSKSFRYDRLDEVFSLVAQYRKPLHAFGRTEPELLFRYPFASGDSTTWFNGGRFGLIIYYDPVARRMYQVSIRDKARMEKCFGLRAKVLIGQIPDTYNRPAYHIQTEECLRQTALEEIDLRQYWLRQGVVWDYDIINNKNRMTPAQKALCVDARADSGFLMPGDPNYVPGYITKQSFFQNYLRPTRKWENEKHEIVPTIADILKDTEFRDNILRLEKTGV